MERERFLNARSLLTAARVVRGVRLWKIELQELLMGWALLLSSAICHLASAACLAGSTAPFLRRRFGMDADLRSSRPNPANAAKQALEGVLISDREIRASRR